MIKYAYSMLIFSALLCGTINTMETKRRPINALENASIGIAAAAAEVAIDQPLVYFKNTIQRGQLIEWTKPQAWYRGAGVNLSSLAPTTATQVMFNGILIDTIGKDSSKTKRFVTAWLAGAISAIFSSPSETLILHQQIGGENAIQTLKKIVKKHGKSSLYRGMLATCIRDGGFSCGYIALGPIIKEYLKKHSDSATLGMAGYVVAGIIAATITHPFDTAKTGMQKDLSAKDGMIKTAWKIVSAEGYKALFKGYIPRSLRVTMAIPIMSIVTELLQEYIATEV